MAQLGVVKGAIGIKDNATAVLRSIKKEQELFRKDVVKTKKELVNTWGKKHTARVETTAAAKKIKALKSSLAPLRKKITTAVAMKDLATSKIKAVSGKLKAVGSKIAKPIVKLKDSATAGIAKISAKLKNLTKAVMIPVAIAGGAAVAGVGAAVKGGMQLEQQQISMEHFIGATNKGMDDTQVKKVSAEFTKALRENANATPFETGDVIAAGSRAISVASGDTKEAMNLVKLAEDMAAASGGTKTIADAMEALADAKVGETERLKEFGFKVSADEMKSKGFKGVSDDLGDFYGGAAEKLATSGAGLMSTINGKLKSNFADFGLSVVEKLKPTFNSVIGLIDKASPVMEKFGGKIADGIGKGIQVVSDLIPKLISGVSTLKPIFTTIISGFKPMMPMLSEFGTAVGGTLKQVMTSAMPVIMSIIQTFQKVLMAVMPVWQTIITSIGSVVSAAAPIISGLVQGIGTAITTLAPVFNTIFGGIADKVGGVIEFIASKMSFITEIINWAAPMISDILNTAWTVISPIMDIAISVFELIFNVVQRVFPGVKKVIETVWGVIKPIVDAVGTVLGGIGSAIGWLADLIGGDSKKSDLEVGTNANGTNNWRGGPTWVGEKGPELLDLPRGSKILPNKESVRYANGVASAPFGVPKASGGSSSAIDKMKQAVTVTIAKLADTIIVHEEADIDKIGAVVAKEVIEAALNLT